MLDIIKRSEYEYMCVIDNNGLNQMVGKQLNEVYDNMNTVKLVVEDAVSRLVKQFDIDENEYDINIQLYATENMVIIVHLSPLSEQEKEPEEDDYVEDSEERDTPIQRHQWNNLHTVNSVMYITNNIENIICAQKQYQVFDDIEATLFHMKGKYIICLHGMDALEAEVQQNIRSKITEYTVTIHNTTYEYLSEYAKMITTDIPTMVDVLVNE